MDTGQGLWLLQKSNTITAISAHTFFIYAEFLHLTTSSVIQLPAILPFHFIAQPSVHHIVQKGSQLKSYSETTFYCLAQAACLFKRTLVSGENRVNASPENRAKELLSVHTTGSPLLQ